MKRLPLEDLDAAIDLSIDSLRALHGARMLLTGCTGLFGVWLLETLRRARERHGIHVELTLLSRNPERFLGEQPWLRSMPDVRFVTGEITSFSPPPGDYSHAIHGATTAAHETFAGEPPMRKFETVALGTRRVLELCEERRVGDMLYLGSGALYGRRDDAERIREDDAAAPNPLDTGSALGEAKRVAELFCAIHAARVPTRIRIARCFTFLGPLLPLDIHYAVGNFLKDALEGRPIVIKGTGRQVRSYLYMSDLVAWLFTILVKGTPLRAYNVGSEDGRPLVDVASLVGRLGGVAVERPAQVAAPQTAAGDRYIPSTARARDELGLRETVSLEDAVRKTLAYHRVSA